MGIKQVQRSVDSVLYYARAIENTILVALNEIDLSQAKPTTANNDKIKMLLNYLFAYPNAKK